MLTQRHDTLVTWPVKRLPQRHNTLANWQSASRANSKARYISDPASKKAASKARYISNSVNKKAASRASSKARYSTIQTMPCQLMKMESVFWPMLSTQSVRVKKKY